MTKQGAGAWSFQRPTSRNSFLMNSTSRQGHGRPLSIHRRRRRLLLGILSLKVSHGLIVLIVLVLFLVQVHFQTKLVTPSSPLRKPSVSSSSEQAITQSLSLSSTRGTTNKESRRTLELAATTLSSSSFTHVLNRSDSSPRLEKEQPPPDKKQQPETHQQPLSRTQREHEQAQQEQAHQEQPNAAANPNRPRKNKKNDEQFLQQQYQSIQQRARYWQTVILQQHQEQESVSTNDGNQMNPTMPRVSASFRTQGHQHHDPCLVFYHVPKVGGTTTSRLLQSLARYWNWTSYAWTDDRRPLTMAAQRNHHLNQGALHQGHVTPYFAEKTHTQQCWTLTVLRHPVDRVISAFYYHGHASQEWPACLTSSNTTIPPSRHTSRWRRSTRNQEQQLQPRPFSRAGDPPTNVFKDVYCNLWFEYRNDMVRRFANRSTALTSYNHYKYASILPTPATTNNNTTANTSTTSTLAESWVADAKATIQEMDFVCVLTHLTSCLERVLDTLLLWSLTTTTPQQQGSSWAQMPWSVHNSSSSMSASLSSSSWLNRSTLGYWNRGRKRQDVSNVMRQQIASANALDLQLYDWVLESMIDPDHLYQ